MRRIGLTGGIGSGKTTVAGIFESLHVPVYYSDDRAKELMTVDIDLIEAVKKEFGEDTYTDGVLNRKALADIVFSDPARLKALNALVHPAVGRDFRAWCEGIETESEYVLKEAAIIFETGGHRFLDEVILVSAPEDLRVSRVMARDEVDEAAVRARMARQWSEEDKLKLADQVILNDGSISLIEQVVELHHELIEADEVAARDEEE